MSYQSSGPERSGTGGGTLASRRKGQDMGLLEHDRLVVNQKAKLIEITNEYAIMDEGGNRIGAIRQEGQTALKKIARLVSSLDQFLTHTVAVYEADGTKLLEIVRPRKIMKSSFQITDGQGVQLGGITQKNVFGKKRFAIIGQSGEVLGAINAQNWRAWNFEILGQTGEPIGRVTKKWAGLGKEMFTSADNYAIEIEPHVQGTLRLLVLASATAIDTALKQDAGGFN